MYNVTYSNEAVQFSAGMCKVFTVDSIKYNTLQYIWSDCMRIVFVYMVSTSGIKVFCKLINKKEAN